MPTEIFEVDNPLAVAFAFDADLNWTETHEYETTDRKVEGKGSIADFIASKPLQATVEGKVTAMNIEPAIPTPQKLVNTRDALEQLIAKKQIVLVLNDLFAGYMGMTRAEIIKSVDGGQSITARIGFKRIEQTIAATAQVPASKLRAKVKRKAAAGKKGGAAKGGKPKTALAKIDDSLNNAVSKFLR